MTRRVWAFAAILILTAVPVAPAQLRPAPAPDSSAFLEGTHAFRRILYDVAGGARSPFTPLRDADAAATDPAHTLIVVLGTPGPLEDLDRRLLPGVRRQDVGLQAFVRRGGALLVATDHKTPPVLENNFGVGVDGTPVTMPILPIGGSGAYRDKPECPFIEAAAGAEPPLFQGLPAFRGQPPRHVASNLPSHLSYPNARFRLLPLLASLPEQCTDGKGTFRRWDFAAGGKLGDGRVLIMADQDVFINMMMLQDDNDNIDFAYRCARWLEIGAQGRRDKVLYSENGAVRTDFDLPLKNLPPLPLPPPDTLLGMFDETLHGMEEDGTFARMEEENFFNGVVEDGVNALPFWEGASPARKIGTFAAVAASLALGLYAFVRLGTFRQRVDQTAPALAALLAKQTPAGAVLEQRQEALLRDGNLGEAARALARHLFVAADASLDTAPAIAVHGGWWRRWRVRRQWQQVWRLARSARPIRVSPRGFARLAARVAELEAALADGTVRIID